MLAAALGANRPDESDPLADADGLSWNQRRAVAIARGEPEPSWDDVPLSPQEQASAARLMAEAPFGMVPPEGMPAI